MRCKNCGYDNDDKLFICKNCGAPLYDEDKSVDEQNGASDSTMVFSAIGDDEVKPVKTPPADVLDVEEEKKEKQRTIIIIALAVVLVAIIIGIIIGVTSNHKAENETTITTTEQTTEETPSSITTQPAETTDETSTSTTIANVNLSLKLTCNDGGEVEGDGTYQLGENVTIIARPDDGYEFGGWYDGSKKVSSNTKYTFTMTGNATLKAVFIIVQMEEPESSTTTTKPTTTTTTTTTTEPATDVENLEGADD